MVEIPTLSVKVNTTDMAQRFEENRARFLREAKTLAKLRNIPQIVGVQSYFTENNTAYIIMDYVDGQDLRHYVQQCGGKVPAREILPILEPVVHALSAVHKEGLMHRDISPDNIMLLPSGEVILLDFGAAHDLEKSDADADLSHSTEAILKHGFAPMEQYRSRGNLGPWTDEYGFCASIYYCLTGEVPPDAPARAMDEVQPDWDSITGLTPNQRAALEKGMEMRAKDRFGSMEALHEALYKNVSVVKETPKPKKKKKWLIPLMILLLLAAGAGGAVWYWGLDTCTEVLMSVWPGARPDTPEETIPVTEAIVAEPTTLPIETTPLTTAPPETTAPSEAPTKPDLTQELWYPVVMAEDPLRLLNIDKVSVKTVTFLDSLDNLSWKAVDLSQAKNGSIMGWGDWNDGYHVYIASEHGVNARDCCEEMFEGCNNLKTIAFNGLFHTDQADSMAYMFSRCNILESVDLEAFKTDNVTDMTSMFYNCSALPSMDIADWDVSKVTKMANLFSNCTNVKNLPVDRWNVAQVTDLSSAFQFCSSISSLDLSKWNTSKAENMASAFYSCSSLQHLDVSTWKVSNVDDMSNMFYNCKDLVTLSLNDWDVSNVINMSGMFRSCTNLRKMELNNWDTSSVTDMSWMFHDCNILTTLDVSNWDVSRVTTMTHMFTGCKSLDFSVLSGWNTSRVRNYEQFTDANILIDGKFWTYFFET